MRKDRIQHDWNQRVSEQKVQRQFCDTLFDDILMLPKLALKIKEQINQLVLPRSSIVSHLDIDIEMEKKGDPITKDHVHEVCLWFEAYHFQILWSSHGKHTL